MNCLRLSRNMMYRVTEDKRLAFGMDLESMLPFLNRNIIGSLMVACPGMDVPTERRVKRWAFGLHELLADPTGRLEFEQFLEKEFSSENIHFWCAVQQLRGLQQAQIADRVQYIYQQYLAPGAPFEINIDSKTMEVTLEALKDPSRYTFDEAQAHIFMLMMKDSYPRFLRSEQYKNLLANAINPFPKKKFFHFGGGVAAVAGLKKKSPMPSPKLPRRGSIGAENDKNLTASPLSQHSYSTGNLRELNDANSAKSSPGGSTCDMKTAQASEDSSSMTIRNENSLSNCAPITESTNIIISGAVPLSKGTTTISSNGGTAPPIDSTKINVVAPWEEVTQL